MLASVIIPTCADESFRIRMEAQLAAQTSRDFETIFVADPERRGPSWARNRGLDQATGDIVLFADVDDEIAPDWVERMTAGCDGVDLFWARATIVPPRTNPWLSHSDDTTHLGDVLCGDAVRAFVWRKVFGYRLRDLINLVLPGGLWHRCRREFGSVCWRAFRREALGGLRFDESVRNGEDALFLAEAATRVHTLRVGDYAGYRYLLSDSGSMSREYRENRLAGKFALRNARARIDPKKTHWRGTFLLSALEILKTAGFACAVRYLTGKDPDLTCRRA